MYGIFSKIVPINVIATSMPSDQSNRIFEFSNKEKLEFKTIFKMYYRPLCYFANKLICNKPEAEDIVTEIFIKLSKVRPRHFKTEDDLRSFLFVITRNACIDFLRKQKRQKDVSSDLISNGVVQERTLEREVIFAKAMQLLFAEMENLPEQCRQVIKGLYLEDKDTATLSYEMNIARQTVLNHKTRALHLLRAALNKLKTEELLLFVLVLCTFINKR